MPLTYKNEMLGKWYGVQHRTVRNTMKKEERNNHIQPLLYRVNF